MALHDGLARHVERLLGRRVRVVQPVTRGGWSIALRAICELEAQKGASVEGDRLLHQDVRSDNLCFRDGGALLVDWNHAVRGDPRWDRLLMLQTIELEGGPRAEAQAPDADPAIITWLAGFFAARVGLPPPEGAPRVRGFQRAQLDVVLPWACRLLDIRPPTG